VSGRAPDIGASLDSSQTSQSSLGHWEKEKSDAAALPFHLLRTCLMWFLSKNHLKPQEASIPKTERQMPIVNDGIWERF
jgi:hypothetical protein